LLDADSELVKTSLEGSDTPFEASLLHLAPSNRACRSSCDRSGRRIGVGRRSSQVTVARKSREPKLMRLPSAKVSPIVKEEIEPSK
jgi:hypothetical protein